MFTKSKTFRSIKSVFNTLLLVGNKISNVLTPAINFLGTCELLIVNIENLMLYNVFNVFAE